MKCPYCSFEESKVVDSRSADDGKEYAEEENVLSAESVLQLMKLLRTFLSMLSSVTNQEKFLTAIS